MRRLIEISKGDSLKELNEAELRKLIENVLPEVYEAGMAMLIQSMINREKDKSMLVSMAENLMKIRFKTNTTGVLTLDLTASHAPAEAHAGFMFSGVKVTSKRVESDTRPGHVHTVVFEDGVAKSCSCESFHYNSERGVLSCKHTKRENAR